jgi:nucleolin
VNHVKIIKDRETGKSKWYGFVEFETSDDAAAARNQMNWSELEWRVLKVEFAEEKVEA